MRYICSFIFLLSSFWAVSQSPTYVDWVERSAAYIENNKLDSAAFALQRAMASDPANEHNPVLLLNLGILQRQLGLKDDAYISFTASMLNNPDPLLVLHNRASLLCDLGRFDEAMEDYNSIIEKDPSNVEAYYRRGILFLEKDNRMHAESDFVACQSIDPDHIFTKLSKALLFKLEDNWPEAEKIYTNIIHTEKNVYSGYYLNRAECYINNDQFSRAAADLLAIEQAEKENPYFYILRGRLRLDQLDKFAAREDFRRAKNLGYDPVIADEWLKKSE